MITSWTASPAGLQRDHRIASSTGSYYVGFSLSWALWRGFAAESAHARGAGFHLRCCGLPGLKRSAAVV